MKTMTAAQAKNSFGKFLDAAQREPVIVTKKDRPVGMMVSMEDLEDLRLGFLSLEARKKGLIGVEASEKLIGRLLNARD